MKKAKRLIRLPSVKHTTGKGHTAIYDGMADGTFPQSVKIGKRAVAWVEEEIEDYIAALIAERDAASSGLKQYGERGPLATEVRQISDSTYFRSTETGSAEKGCAK